jgi:hypothetical protein
MADRSTKDDIEFMLNQFKPERYAYLAVTIASFLLLLACVIIFIIQSDQLDEKRLGYVAGMVGSGGAIAYADSQLLRMWRDCMEYLSKQSSR